MIAVKLFDFLIMFKFAKTYRASKNYKLLILDIIYISSLLVFIFTPYLRVVILFISA